MAMCFSCSISGECRPMPSPSLMLTMRKEEFDAALMTPSALFTVEPDGDGAAMRGQAFGPCERERGGPKPRQCLGIAGEDTGSLKEIQHG